MDEEAKEYEQFEETKFDKDLEFIEDCIAKLKQAEDDSLFSMS